MKIVVTGASGCSGRPLVARLSADGCTDGANLERITPPFLRCRLVGSSTPTIGEGTRLDDRLRLHGVPVGWRSLSEDWQPGRRFVARQLRGRRNLARIFAFRNATAAIFAAAAAAAREQRVAS